MSDKPVLGIIGGSGFYEMEILSHVEDIVLDTPFGAPSSPIRIGECNGKKVAFLARHGLAHTIAPHNINYRANICALKMLGVNSIVSVSACGSLRSDFEPGNFVIPDQLVDFTRSRQNSFFTDDVVAHVTVGDPFCQPLCTLLGEAATGPGAKTHITGTCITIEGPRFSTKAESNLFRSWGLSLIGMTACPEAFLAREAGICYAMLAHITDFDVWHVSEEPVSVELVSKTLRQNAAAANHTLENMIDLVSGTEVCTGCESMDSAIITNLEYVAPETLEKLAFLLPKSK